MRTIAVFLLGAGWLLASQTGGTGKVSGTVLRSSNGEPLGGATVILTTRVLPDPSVGGAAPPLIASLMCPPAGVPPSPTLQLPAGLRAGSLRTAPGGVDREVTADAVGNFSFEQVPVGIYHLYAIADGYVRTENGVNAVRLAGEPIEIGAGAIVSGITVRLPRAPTVSGRIVRPNGQAAVNVSVLLLRFTFDAYGERTSRALAGTTDDRGNFRLPAVAPGRYHLLAGCPNVKSTLFKDLFPDDPTVKNAWTYYPGTIDRTAAKALDVEPNIDLEGLNFVLESRARTYTLRGVVQLPTTASVNLSDLRTGQTGIYEVDPNTGIFEATDLDAGFYTLRLGSGRAPTSLVRVPIDFDDTVHLFPTAISGQLLVEGAVALALNTAVRLRANSLMPSGMRELILPLDADGTFNAQLHPGEYHFSMDGLPRQFLS